MIVRWPAFAFLFAVAAAAHAAVAFLPLASVDDSGAPRLDGIEVVELPSMRVLRNVAVAPGFDFVAASPDGATLAVRESPPFENAIAIYDARTGGLRHRWPTSGCAFMAGDASWHPLRREILVLRGACFFNVETGAIEETPETLGVNLPLYGRFATTSDRRNYLVVPQATAPGVGATLVRVIDLRDPRNGRDFPGTNGWGALGFGETTLISQRAGGVHYTDLATDADLGAVPMPAGWAPLPPYRALPDGTIVATALGAPGARLRLVRLRDRTTPGELIAELPPFIGPPVYLEIGDDFALFSNWLRPSCPIAPPCFAGPATITAIELASGRTTTRAYPTQALAAEGPLLAGGSAPVVAVPALRPWAWPVLLALLTLVVRRRMSRP